jgi:hypothetical protein
MIMFTADYRQLCRSLGVAFIDHEPIAQGALEAPSVEETVTFMRKCGVRPDPALWEAQGPARCCSGHVSLD